MARRADTSRTTIATIERGSDCNAGVLGRLADAFDCVVDDLFERVGAARS